MPAISGPSQFFTCTGVSVAQRPQLAGTILYDVIKPVTMGGTPSDTTWNMQFRVVRSTKTGLLDFYWRVVSPISLPAGVRFFASGFNLYFNKPLTITYADYRTDGLGSNPPSRIQMGAGIWMNKLINFQFLSNDFRPGSRFIFASTQATNFTPNGGESDTLYVSGQYATIPGPA